MLSGTVVTWADRAVKDGMEQGRLETWLDRIIPDGHFKFLHPWPGQIPPGQDSEECLSVG